MADNEVQVVDLEYNEEMHSFVQITTTYVRDGVHLNATNEEFVTISNADALKFLRSRSGLSQTEFAQKFYIPAQTYSQWEAGRRNPPEYVIEMINHILEEEELRKFPTGNSEMYLVKIYRILMELNCPVRFWDSDRIVMVKDTLGQDRYYLTAGEFDVADISRLTDWLNANYDADAEQKIHSDLEVRRNEHGDDSFCSMDYFTNLQDKFGEDIRGHHLNRIYNGR